VVTYVAPQIFLFAVRILVGLPGCLVVMICMSVGLDKVVVRVAVALN
jgi:hypothetical protein